MVRDLLANYHRVAFIFISQINNYFEYISRNIISFKDDFCNVYWRSVCKNQRDNLRMAIMAYFFEIKLITTRKLA